MEFLTFIGHSDYVGDGVETCLITGLITGLINAGINVVRLQIHWRFVNEQLAIKLATILMADVESDKFNHCK